MIQIKRLKQANTDFVPITVAEAVVVNCNDYESITGKSIDTLENVLNGFLQLSLAIESKKLDKLIPGPGITISDKNEISINFSTELYTIVTELPEPSAQHLNKLYLIPFNSEECLEYLCIEIDGEYKWELIGSIPTKIDLSGYVTKEEFTDFTNVAVTAKDIKINNKPLGVEIEGDLEELFLNMYK